MKTKTTRALIFFIMAIAWSLIFYGVLNPISSSSHVQPQYNKIMTNAFIKPHESRFGVVLFAYSHFERECVHYLTEAYVLCHRLSLRNVNQSYDLNISLFTMEQYYTKYMENSSSFVDCVFDNVIFLEQLLPQWQTTNYSLNKENKGFTTRIQLLSHSPYYLTMTLDTDFYPCRAFNFDNLYSQMEANDIDFSYTSARRRSETNFRIPQGGLFLYRNNNKTKYFFKEWHSYHMENDFFDDQMSLHEILNAMLPSYNMSVHMLNNRYDFRRFGLKGKKHIPRIQLLYPNNRIVMFHRRDYTKLAPKTPPDEICQTLNKYPNTLTLGVPYEKQSISKFFNCFIDSEPNCFEYFENYLNLTHQKINEYKNAFANAHRCPWNENVDFVPYDQDIGIC